MKYKAVQSVLCYPDGRTAVRLVEGQSYDFDPPFAEFMLKRKLIKKGRETKPKAEAKQTKPVAKVEETKGLSSKNLFKV